MSIKTASATEVRKRLINSRILVIGDVMLGAGASLLGIIGSDQEGVEVERHADAVGINSKLRQSKSSPTIVKTRIVGCSQQLLQFDRETTPHADILSLLRGDYSDLLPSHDMVICSNYAKGSLQFIVELIAQARHIGKPVLVDPIGYDYSKYCGATALTPNRAELKLVVGEWCSEEELAHKAQRLRKDYQIESLVLTRSEEGIPVFDDDGSIHFPAVTRDVFDVTGAGDSVIATLACLISIGLTIRQAAKLANKAEGIVVGKIGAATISLDELIPTSEKNESMGFALT